MTERTEPTRSKLVKLKQWLTVSDAAQYLALLCGEDVSEPDIYQLALDGGLQLSVRFVNSVPARPKDPMPKEKNLVWLRGVYDLSMTGVERLDVERAYQALHPTRPISYVALVRLLFSSLG